MTRLPGVFDLYRQNGRWPTVAEFQATRGRDGPDLRAARLRDAKARIDRALASGNPKWLIADGIADDENLEGLKSELNEYLDAR